MIQTEKIIFQNTNYHNPHTQFQPKNRDNFENNGGPD